MLFVARLLPAARAQADLAGSWAARNHEDALERNGGPYAVDYTGLPLNDDGRAKALSYSASQLAMIERQCGLWPPFYLDLGPFGMKMWNETDPVSGTTLAWKIGGLGRPGDDDDLDGRTSASIKERAARARRVHHRRVAGHHARRLHDAHEGRFDPPQRGAE